MSLSGRYRRISVSVLTSAIVFSLPPHFARASGLSASQLQSELNNLQSQIDLLRAQQQVLNAQQAAVSQQQAQLKVQARQQATIAMEQTSVAKQQEKILASQPPPGKYLWYAEGDLPIPTFVSADGKSSIRISGDIQLDTNLANIPGQHGYSGAANFRRAIIGLHGIYDTNFLWTFVENFATTGSPLGGFLDAYIGYTNKFGGVRHTILAGNQLVPFELQVEQFNTTFLEFSQPSDVWYPGRQVGITDHAYQQHWNAWFGIQGAKATTETSAYTGNSQLTASSTLAYDPINVPGYLVSFRNSLMFNKFNATNPTYGTYPESETYGTSLQTTGALNIQSDLIEAPRFDLEWNHFSLGATYYFVRTQNHDNVFVSKTDHRVLTPKFSGWDVEADYFLTNDHKPFDTAGGYYATVVPTNPLNEGGYGAWQVAARLDNADLNDARDKIRGGNETNFTAGLNWYPISSIRVMVNYIKVFKLDGGPFNGDAPSIFATRLQFLY